MKRSDDSRSSPELAAPVVVSDVPGGAESWLQRDITATLVSAVIHLSLLLLLALWVIPSVVGPPAVRMQASFSESETVVLSELELEVQEAPDAESPTEQKLEVVEVFPTQQFETALMKPDTSDEEPLLPAEETLEASESVQAATSTSIEQAVDSLTGSIESKLEKGDVLVVWLLDASASLVDDRKRVAERLTPFYQRIAEKQSSLDHRLESAVVSFASKMRERIPPTQFGDRIVSEVESIPVDRSGHERVFDAVARCAEHYRNERPSAQIVIAVWTDESGDDTAYLENTIAICQKQQAAVSVVGPSSVLGADTGLHSYTDPKSRSNYLLPVKRGPDAAQPERLELGYWYVTRMGGGRFGRGLPAWVGGQDLEGILCGFSPYALTRLASQTGGTYTIFDRREDRSPFDLIKMEKYAPSYQSLEAYQKSIREHPLREAVIDAVRELEGKKIDAPETRFFIKKTGERFFDFARFYYPPREFQSKLRNSRARLTRQAARYSTLVEKALLQVSEDGDPDQGLDGFFSAEIEPRWRAWYDLTRGRLLATSVRLEEYRLTLQAMTKPGGLASTTNFVTLTASMNLRSDSAFRRRAKESRELLDRCIRQHANTPWEVLAMRELDFGYGIAVQEMALTPNPGGPLPKAPNLPRF